MLHFPSYFSLEVYISNKCLATYSPYAHGALYKNCQLICQILSKTGKCRQTPVQFTNTKSQKTVYALRKDLFGRYKPTDPQDHADNWLRTQLKAQTEGIGRKCWKWTYEWTIGSMEENQLHNKQQKFWDAAHCSVEVITGLVPYWMYTWDPKQAQKMSFIRKSPVDWKLAGCIRGTLNRYTKWTWLLLQGHQVTGKLNDVHVGP
jgi:hypothetical protein